MTNKYFEIAKKATVDYIENRISALEFQEIFEKLNETEIYKNLEKDGKKGVSNYISTVVELDDLSTLESQWIVEVIDLFYAYFTDNYDYVYSEDFYKFLKISLNKENNTPVRTSFKQAVQSYLDEKISGGCLAYIAGEFLNNLKFFRKEINEDKQLLDILSVSLKLKFNKILEDLTSEEIQIKKDVDDILKKYSKGIDKR